MDIDVKEPSRTQTVVCWVEKRKESEHEHASRQVRMDDNDLVIDYYFVYIVD